MQSIIQMVIFRFTWYNVQELFYLKLIITQSFTEDIQSFTEPYILQAFFSVNGFHYLYLYIFLKEKSHEETPKF